MAHAALSTLGNPGRRFLQADRNYIWADPATVVELDVDVQEESLRVALGAEPGPERDELIMQAVADEGRLLEDEPALAMRVLTNPRGQVQAGVVAFVEELLRRDIEEFGLVTLIDPDALAYALVRLGESFLYADVLAARKPDVETANRLQRALIEGILP